jgi:hypothetical protein
MENITDTLKDEFARCHSFLLTKKYVELLGTLRGQDLTERTAKYLCEKAADTSKIWEIRYEHLAVLLLSSNLSSLYLKEWFLDAYGASRNLTLKLLFLRGYAEYASESELVPVVKDFTLSLKNAHEVTDFEYILSEIGLLYLVKKHRYGCFDAVLEAAKEKYESFPDAVRGFFTVDENFRKVSLLPDEEIRKRTDAHIKQFDTWGYM